MAAVRRDYMDREQQVADITIELDAVKVSLELHRLKIMALPGPQQLNMTKILSAVRLMRADDIRAHESILTSFRNLHTSYENLIKTEEKSLAYTRRNIPCIPQHLTRLLKDMNDRGDPITNELDAAITDLGYVRDRPFVCPSLSGKEILFLVVGAELLITALFFRFWN